MPKKLEWDKIGEREFQTGVEKGVLFPQASDGQYEVGVAWNGLQSVTDKPTGAESKKIYANNGTYLTITSNEETEFSISAYMYPDEWEECDGSKQAAQGVAVRQQTRKRFGFSYVTLLGSDTEDTDHGYIIHLMYGCTASPSEKAYETKGEDTEAMSFSWDVKTTPVSIPIEGFKPSASIEINSLKANPEQLKAFEKILYGSNEADAKLPLPQEIFGIFTGGGAGVPSNDAEAMFNEAKDAVYNG